MKQKDFNLPYKTPEIRVVGILLEGVLCASDSFESYKGTDDFEELF